MADRPLARCGVSALVVTQLAKVDVHSCKDLLEASVPKIMSADMSLKEAKKLIREVSEKIAPVPITALQMLHDRSSMNRFLPSGLALLDDKMRGGLIIGGISEVVGPPGVGKTQYCFSCCVQSVARRMRSNGGSGEGGGGGTAAAPKIDVVYFDTELKFNADRLAQLAVQSIPDLFSPANRLDYKEQTNTLLASIALRQPKSSRELREQIDDLEDFVIANNTALIVLDSVAALARKEGLHDDEKEQFLVGQAAALKRLSERCGCVVLVTNQVTPDFVGSAARASIGGSGDAFGDAISDQASVYRPTLGPLWHHCVSTRLAMSTVSSYGVDGERKQISLVKSPLAEQATIAFRICSEGLVGCELE